MFSFLGSRGFCGVLTDDGAFSTGLPNGVQLTHRNIVANILMAEAVSSMSHKDVVLAFLPLFHILGKAAGSPEGILSWESIQLCSSKILILEVDMTRFDYTTALFIIQVRKGRGHATVHTAAFLQGGGGSQGLSRVPCASGRLGARAGNPAVRGRHRLVIH